MPALQTLETQADSSGVLHIRLNRPEIRNAFNEAVIAELTSVFTKAAHDPGVRIAVLRGAGPVFSAGGDLGWMKKSMELSRDENLEDTRRLSAMFRAMNDFPKPLIGLAHGAAIGGGVGLVSVCDIVIASRETIFSLSEVRLGIVPACIGPYVISKIGASHARRFFLSAERFEAPKALEIGLIHEMVEKPEDLDRALFSMLSNMLQCGPAAMAAAKKLILDLSVPEKREKVGDPCEYVSSMLADLRVSPEGQEGLRAFLEKRKPSWIQAK